MDSNTENTYIVVKAFQFRGGIVRAGQTIILTPERLRDPFVAKHVKPLSAPQATPSAPSFTRGTPLPKAPTGALAAAPETVAQLKAALDAIGCSYPARATRAELAALLKDAQAFAAGKDAAK